MKHSVASYNTKKNLSEALKKLLLTTDLDRISITDLVREAGVNRKTFYYHFNDVYELISWTLRTEAMEKLMNFNILSDYRKGIKFVMDYVEKNQEIIINVAHSSAASQVRKLLCEGIRAPLTIAIGEIEDARNEEFEPGFRDFLTEFFTEAIAGLIASWAQDPNRRSRAHIETYLTQIFDQTASNLKQL